MIEVRIGRNIFPVVTFAVCHDGDLLIVFVNNNVFWGQSTRTGMLAPLKFDKKRGKTTWGGKVVKFVL